MGKRKGNNNYLDLSHFYDMCLYYDDYIIDGIKDEVKRQAKKEKDSEYPSFITEDDELYLNAEGAKKVCGWINVDYDNYEDTIDFLIDTVDENKDDRPELNTELDIRVKDNLEIDPEYVKNYLEYVVVGICTLGAKLEDLDLDKLRTRDINTINGTVDAYNQVINKRDNGQYYRTDEPIYEAYKYVDSSDPEILRRMRYYHKQKPIGVGEHLERYKFMEHENLKQQVIKDFNKGRQPKKRFKKKNNKYKRK